MRRLTRTVLVTVLAGIVVACGGSGSAASPTAGQGPTAPPAAATPGPDASATEPGAPSAAPQPTPGAGGPAATVCELVSAVEFAQILGVSGVTTQVIAGPPDTCDVQSDGAPLAAMVLMPTNGTAVFSAWASDPGAIDVSGIGDRAVYVPSSLLFIVLRGDAVLSLALFDEGQSEEARLELMKEIAALAAGRM